MTVNGSCRISRKANLSSQCITPLGSVCISRIRALMDINNIDTIRMCGFYFISLLVTGRTPTAVNTRVLLNKYITVGRGC